MHKSSRPWADHSVCEQTFVWPTFFPSNRTLKPQSHPPVDFTPPVALTYSFDQAPPVDIASSADTLSQLDSSDHKSTPQEQLQALPQLVSNSPSMVWDLWIYCYHLNLLLQMCHSSLFLSCAPPVELQQSVPVNHQASGKIQSRPELTLPADLKHLESKQAPTVYLQQPTSDVMPPCAP